MIRKTKNISPEYPVCWHFPLFIFTGCCNCENEWRRERGWRFTTGPYRVSKEFGPQGVNRYIGPCCATTEIEAGRIAKEVAEFRPDRPPPPPPPPPKT